MNSRHPPEVRHFITMIRFKMSQGRRSEPHRMNDARWFIAALLLLVLTPGRRCFADTTASDPARETHAMVAQALAILHNTSMSVEERRRLMLQLAASELDFERI